MDKRGHAKGVTFSRNTEKIRGEKKRGNDRNDDSLSRVSRAEFLKALHNNQLKLEPSRRAHEHP